MSLNNLKINTHLSVFKTVKKIKALKKNMAITTGNIKKEKKWREPSWA
jgi:hypothetical protein